MNTNFAYATNKAHPPFIEALRQRDAMTTPLPCGCIRGEYLCPTAEHLWQRCNIAWTIPDELEYARLRQEYEAHFEQAQEPQP